MTWFDSLRRLRDSVRRSSSGAASATRDVLPLPRRLIAVSSAGVAVGLGLMAGWGEPRRCPAPCSPRVRCARKVSARRCIFRKAAS